MCTVKNATHQDIVRFDVGVKNAASFEEFQGQEELGGVGPHCLDVQTDIFPIALQNLTQVHTVRYQFTHKTFESFGPNLYLGFQEPPNDC